MGGSSSSMITGIGNVSPPDTDFLLPQSYVFANELTVASGYALHLRYIGIYSLNDVARIKVWSRASPGTAILDQDMSAVTNDDAAYTTDSLYYYALNINLTAGTYVIAYEFNAGSTVAFWNSIGTGPAGTVASTREGVTIDAINTYEAADSTTIPTLILENDSFWLADLEAYDASLVRTVGSSTSVTVSSLNPAGQPVALVPAVGAEWWVGRGGPEATIIDVFTSTPGFSINSAGDLVMAECPTSEGDTVVVTVSAFYAFEEDIDVDVTITITVASSVAVATLLETPITGLTAEFDTLQAVASGPAPVVFNGCTLSARSTTTTLSLASWVTLAAGTTLTSLGKDTLLAADSILTVDRATGSASLTVGRLTMGHHAQLVLANEGRCSATQLGVASGGERGTVRGTGTAAGNILRLRGGRIVVSGSHIRFTSS